MSPTKPRVRVPARMGFRVIEGFGAGLGVLHVLDTMRHQAVDERAVAVAVVIQGRAGNVVTHLHCSCGGSFHALAGGIMSLLYRVQHQMMEWQ